MKIFLAGGCHSKIGPAYKRMVADNDISGDGFARALVNENFWLGGSEGIGQTDCTTLRP